MNLVPKVAIGLMSGTSCDGVDAALIETDGERILSRGDNCFIPYELSEQETLKSAMQQIASTKGMEERLDIASSVEALIREKHRLAVEMLLQKKTVIRQSPSYFKCHNQSRPRQLKR
jgi:anhydro-N-acetylmuramic acid kinase